MLLRVKQQKNITTYQYKILKFTVEQKQYVPGSVESLSPNTGTCMLYECACFYP